MRFPDSSSTKTAAVPVSAAVSRQETSHESDLGGCTARPGEGIVLNQHARLPHQRPQLPGVPRASRV